MGRSINRYLQKQRIEELLADKEESLEACRCGEVRMGTMDDLLKDLEEDLRD